MRRLIGTSGIRRISVAVGTLFLVLAVSASASASRGGGPDPDAPPGASPEWLPQTDWVLEHWVPYDETRLESLLHTHHAAILAFLGNNEHTLADLVVRQGLDPARIQRALLRPWRGHVPARQYRILARRTLKTFTQSHLAHHILGHLFHQRSLEKAANEIYGTDMKNVAALRRQGLSRAQIGARAGRTYTMMRTTIVRILRASAAKGVRLKAVSRTEARHRLDLQLAALERWLTRVPGGGSHQTGAGRVAAPRRTGLASPSVAGERALHCSLS